LEQASVREHESEVTRGGQAPPGGDLAKQYTQVSLVLLPALAGIIWIATDTAAPVSRPTVLLGPVVALLALTGVVFLLMLGARHGSILLRQAPIDFFRNFDGAQIPDWVERPARTFNNLMQVPTVFYSACAFMLQTGLVDSVQVRLAWAFVAARIAHAFVFIGWNTVRWRFAMAMLAFVSVGIIVYRFAVQSWPLRVSSLALPPRSCACRR